MTIPGNEHPSEDDPPDTPCLQIGVAVEPPRGLVWGQPPVNPATIAHPTIDWRTWLRDIERRRRIWGRRTEHKRDRSSPHPSRKRDRRYLALVTRLSFETDGIRIEDRALDAALLPGAAHRPFITRPVQRVRNHVAILWRISSIVQRVQSLDTQTVVRWYTLISCGLSSAHLDLPSLARLERVVGRINAPQMNLRPALEEAARLYAELLADPIVPSFNGILARLLLFCQLGRCGFPPLAFDLLQDRKGAPAQGALLGRLLEIIRDSYDVLLRDQSGSNGAGRH